MPHTLFRRRLIFVTGKGGVGKTTVALALGLAAASSGRRTIVADLNADGDQRESELAPNLFRTSVDPQGAMEQYLQVKVPGAAGQALRQSRLFSAFAMATPGMRELLCMGRIWELAQLERRTHESEPYDLVIVDAPASGHGAAILRTPRTFAEIARVGPIANQAQAIARTVADAAFTAVVAVCTPEEMPVNETLELRDALARPPAALRIESVILNCRRPDRFDAADVATLGEALRARAAPPAALAAVTLALEAHSRAASEHAQEQRLRAAFGQSVLVLPFLFAASVERPQLEQLAEGLRP